MAEQLDCEHDECPWKSKKGELTAVVKLYEIHLKVKHSSPQIASKPEKAKRPELAAEMSDEDWMYFKARWSDYKKATGISGDDIITQLMEHCFGSIRRDHYRTFSKAEGDEGSAITEIDRLQELKQLAVIKKIKAVNRVKYGNLRRTKVSLSGRLLDVSAVLLQLAITW